MVIITANVIVDLDVPEAIWSDVRQLGDDIFGKVSVAEVISGSTGQNTIRIHFSVLVPLRHTFTIVFIDASIHLVEHTGVLVLDDLVGLVITRAEGHIS